MECNNIVTTGETGGGGCVFALPGTRNDGWVRTKFFGKREKPERALIVWALQIPFAFLTRKRAEAAFWIQKGADGPGQAVTVCFIMAAKPISRRGLGTMTEALSMTLWSQRTAKYEATAATTRVKTNFQFIITEISPFIQKVKLPWIGSVPANVRRS